MAFRNVFLQNDVHLKIKNEQLVVEETNDKITIPLEDLNSVCIESLRTVISTYTLKKFIEHDIIVYICDEKHLPTGVLIGTNNYSRQLKNIKMQIEMSKPLMKRIWQDIIKIKVLNQARCLKELNIKEYQKLEDMVIGITSGDKNNVEAKAASLYFKLIFGNEFNRDLDCVQNAALNYGYAIIRGMIARTLVMYGFEPSIGIFHHSQLNNFNLADDFIECFRPVVDLYVLTKVNLEEDKLTSENKKEIFRIVNCLVLIDGKKFNIQGAIEYMIKSFSTCMNKKENVIKLPDLITLEEYRYA